MIAIDFDIEQLKRLIHLGQPINFNPQLKSDDYYNGHSIDVETWFDCDECGTEIVQDVEVPYTSIINEFIYHSDIDASLSFVYDILEEYGIKKYETPNEFKNRMQIEFSKKEK